MTAVEKTSDLIVRPRSSWQQHLMVSLAAFGVTVALVHFISLRRFPESSLENGSKAIAIVDEKPANNQEKIPADLVLKSSLHLENVKNRISSPAFLEQALLDCGMVISLNDNKDIRNTLSKNVEQVQQGLSVRAKTGHIPGAYRLTIELKLSQSQGAARLARALADSYVRLRRTQWTSQMQEAYLSASARAKQDNDVRDGAVAELTAFLGELSIQKQLQPKPMPSKDKALPQPSLRSGPVPQTIDNPDWDELSNKLISLKQQLAKMLEEMTPLHPEVRYVRDNITDIEEQLAITPRVIVKTSPEVMHEDLDLSTEVNTSTDEDLEKSLQEEVANNNADAQQAETLEQLQEAVELAEQDYQVALISEKQRSKACRLVPVLSVHVNQVALVKKQQKPKRELMGLILFSGFALAVGVGMFSTGVATESVLSTMGRLEPLLPAPIIGVVPDQNTLTDPIARNSQKLNLRWMLILFGGM